MLCTKCGTLDGQGCDSNVSGCLLKLVWLSRNEFLCVTQIDSSMLPLVHPLSLNYMDVYDEECSRHYKKTGPLKRLPRFIVLKVLVRTNKAYHNNHYLALGQWAS